MRIGLTCATIDPILTQGKIDGIGVHTQSLYDQFLKLNYRVTPYTFPMPKRGYKTSSLPNGKALPLPFNVSTVISLSNTISQMLYRHLKKDIDILHITDHLIPRVRNIPVVATMHDALIFSRPEWYPTRLNGLKDWFRKQSMHWATHFITISHAMVPELVKYAGIPENKISVVYNGISPWWHENVSETAQENVLAKFNLNKKFLLFTGTLQPKKNVSRLIEAYLGLPEDIREEYSLVIVGKSGWEAEDSLASINQLISSNQGHWLKYVSNEELRALYHAASLYVYPSLHEGFGYTLLEAFASNTPVITSNLSALPEVAGGAAYTCDPYSSHDIRHAMFNVLTSPSLQQEMVKKGAARVKEFSLEKCAKETLRVYEGIV